LHPDTCMHAAAAPACIDAARGAGPAASIDPALGCESELYRKSTRFGPPLLPKKGDGWLLAPKTRLPGHARVRGLAGTLTWCLAPVCARKRDKRGRGASSADRADRYAAVYQCSERAREARVTGERQQEQPGQHTPGGQRRRRRVPPRRGAKRRSISQTDLETYQEHLRRRHTPFSQPFPYTPPGPRPFRKVPIAPNCAFGLFRRLRCATVRRTRALAGAVVVIVY